MDPAPQINYSSIFFASIQSSSEVLFVCIAGYMAAKCGIITENSQKNLSQLLIQILMPCLLFSEIGPVVDINKLITLWPLPVFTLIFIMISALFGIFGGKMVLSLSTADTKFVMTGIMFNNLASLLMGLLRGMENTSAMELFSRDKEDTPEASIKRGNSYVLLAVLFNTLLRWSLGAYLLKKETPIVENIEENDQQQITYSTTYSTIIIPTTYSAAAIKDSPLPIHFETTQLLNNNNNNNNNNDHNNNNDINDHNNNNNYYYLNIIKNNKTIKKINEFMNPPLYAALLALIVGTTKPLKLIFFGHDAPLAVFTQAIDYIGTITIPLTLMALGAQLANLPTRPKGGKSIFPSIGYILICRFLIMPVIGIIIVLLTKNWFVRDPMLWFILMMLASGPTAVNCLNLAYLNKSFEEEMATLLFYSYMAVAPLITIIVMGVLSIIGKGKSRS
ncbi:hypothetical protein Glove_153g41 [Diversispora epigaea]|uniref:Auxin efflux carrier n=1 Tax=Diversispora epigaea TaxID=1348612 RepID=A0A397J237_9GLOM|nr:hypothetical protein Glove_153g41 [Diversispora epigaea]